MTWTIKEARTANSTYPKGGVSCFKDNFVVNQTFVFQIKFCGESPALRVAAKRYVLPSQKKSTLNLLKFYTSYRTILKINK